MALLADTITPYLGATACYLFVLNAVLGWIEAGLLRRFFGGRRRAVLWMIPANYASAWVGLAALGGPARPTIRGWLGDRPLDRVNAVAVAVWAIAFVVTLAVEGPFVWFALTSDRRSVRQVATATLAVNAATYGLVGLLFLTSFSLPLNATVVPLVAMSPLPAGTLYWVRPGGAVLARRFGPGPTADRGVGHVRYDKFVQPYMLDAVAVDSPARRAALQVRYGEFSYGNGPPPPGEAAPEPAVVLADAGPAFGLPADYAAQPRPPDRTVLDLRPPDRRQIDVRVDVFRDQIDTAVPGGRTAHLTVGFGPVLWHVENPLVLPGGLVLFDWEGQLVLFDPVTGRIAFVVAGSCPAFVPDGTG